MPEIKWIKLSVNMFDDEKIKLIRTMPEGDAISLIWIQMLCLAGRINDGGLVYMGQNLAYSDEMLATILGHPLNTMRVALQALEQFDMIEITSDGKIDILNWEKHQSTDKMQRIKEQNRDRKRKYDLRQKLRQIGHNPDGQNVPSDLSTLEEYVAELVAEHDNTNDYNGNVTVTSGNVLEVRSKKLEVRSKKLDNIPPNSVVESDFEKLWKLYPKKERKQDALKAYKKAIKDGVTNKEIQDGILNYKKKLEAEGTEHQYIAQGGTWFNQQRWNDEYVISKPKPKNNYRRGSNYQEIIPSWMKDKETGVKQQEVNAVDLPSEEDMRQRLNELIGEE